MSKESYKQVSWLWEPAVIIFYGFMKKRVWLAIVGVVVLCIGICYYMFFGRYSWSLSDDGKLTISGLDRPYYLDDCPWLDQREEIKEVVIEDGITSIEDDAFSGCPYLTSITIPNSVTKIEDEAFYGCSGLKSIKVKDGNPKYDSRNYCNAIIETESNTLILGCKNTVIPNSVKWIGDCAFGDCSELTSITIPNSVAGIGEKAFYGCSGLTSVTIPESVTEIGYKAFYGCSRLTSIAIPESVTSIDCEAFSGTKWYENQPDGWVYIGGILYNYKGTWPAFGEIVIKENTKIIAGRVFAGCSDLWSITIPESVTSIGGRAFEYCSNLRSITIPNSVTFIGYEAFGDCLNLRSITCLARIPPDIEYGWCGADSYRISLYVPAESVEAYKKAEGWKEFHDIKAIK